MAIISLPIHRGRSHFEVTMEKVKGYIDHIIYRNSDNGYTVMEVIAEGEEVICVGTFETLDQGENLELDGEYTEHPVYGEQFKVKQYTVLIPEDAQSMQRYLASGAIKGIAVAMAARIVKKFGEDSFRIMEEEPERLAEIKGISEKKAMEIARQMEEKKETREAMLFLQKYGISNALALKIHETYGSRMYRILQENPYQMAEDIAGVGFRTADEIAEKAGIHLDSDYRIRSGILYVLLLGASDGHVYLPKEEVVQRSAALLKLSAEQIDPQIMNLTIDKQLLLKEKNGVIQAYTPINYYMELNCARMLNDLDASFSLEGAERNKEEEKTAEKTRQLEKSLNLVLDDLQRKAVVESVNHGIFVLSGGPGTGKTTTINMMIRFFEEEGLTIFLAAPTGRAAKRMTEATGYEARTIHRLLELSGAMQEENKAVSFERNEENPLEAEVVIIDEMSMVDIHLFHALLKAIAPGTRLILVGDINQLPSVGPGQVLKDIMESTCFKTVVLRKIFRQAEESHIIVNAHLIHKGQQIQLDNKSRDFFFLERKEIPVIYKHMIQLIQEKLPQYVDAEPYDIQVLTPMRKGNLGVEVLNGILQKYLNPADPMKKEYSWGQTLFREGDKVMQIKNNYQTEWEIVSIYGITIDKGMGVFNGDTGIIKEIDETNQHITVEFDDLKRVMYPFSSLDELEHAYAITIHKSQGSEYPAVVMPIFTGPKMLFNRNLLYTGVTRAKRCVTILGSSEMLKTMIANENEQKRYTGLQSRIREVKEAFDK